MEIRALREDDDRSEFRSGDPDLDRFLHSFAGQNQFKHHIGVSYVAAEGRSIVGYVTIAAGQVEIEDLPASDRRKLPRYPLPVLRVARLAVAESARGQGLGRQLLRFALEMALRMGNEYGCVGVVVDAKPAAVEFYARMGFVPLDALEGQADARPQPTPMFLSMRVIRASVA
jgi:GNAT superfamily N-acetyltransferase